jgi:hypothetical protein
MKKFISILLLALAVSSVTALATTPTIPGWFENLTPGQSYTSGGFGVEKGLAENTFTPQGFMTQISYINGDPTGVQEAGTINTGVSTAITGVQTGMDRQLLYNGGNIFVKYNGPVAYDSENPIASTIDQVGYDREQWALISTDLSADPVTGAVPAFLVSFPDYSKVGPNRDVNSAAASVGVDSLYANERDYGDSVVVRALPDSGTHIIEAYGGETTKALAQQVLTQAAGNAGTKTTFMNGESNLYGGFMNAVMPTGESNSIVVDLKTATTTGTDGAIIPQGDQFWTSTSQYSPMSPPTI